MLRKITEIWPSLLRGDYEPSDSEESSHSRRDGEEGSGPSLRVDGDQLLLDYKNLYWTRLMAIEVFAPGFDRKHALGPDIVDELQEKIADRRKAPNSSLPLFS